MSISSALNNALSGLTAASRMAEVVSANLANALTDGYGRRTLELSAHSVAGQSAGVRIDGVQRHVDRALLSERWLAEAPLAAATERGAALDRLETAIGGPDDPSGLAARLVALEQAFMAAGADPSSEIRLGTVLSRLVDVSRAFNERSAAIDMMRQEADARIAEQVSILNASLEEVETLNRDIARLRAVDGDPSALLDQRQVVVDRISGIVPVRALDRPQGQIALITTSGETLIDGPPTRFGFTATPTITPDMTLASGGLAGITRAGVPIDPARGFGALAGGSLAAAFSLRDETLVAASADLDALARDLLQRFENPASDPTRPPGLPGLLTEAGGSYDPSGPEGLARRIRVNPLIDPAQGGALFRLRDGIGSAAPGPVGNAVQLEAFRAALSAQQSLVPGGPARGLAEHAAALSARIGSDRVFAEERQGFLAARHAALKEAELAQGVDSDQEMQMLLRIEQAYAANARVMQTLDAMIKRLMEI